MADPKKIYLNDDIAQLAFKTTEGGTLVKTLSPTHAGLQYKVAVTTDDVNPPAEGAYRSIVGQAFFMEAAAFNHKAIWVKSYGGHGGTQILEAQIQEY